MTTGEERHEQNITRLVRLEMAVDAIRGDVGEIKVDLKPLKEAFQRASGLQSAAMAVWMLIVASLGAGFGAITTWLLGRH
jgi:hypothetical protein